MADSQENSVAPAVITAPAADAPIIANPTVSPAVETVTAPVTDSVVEKPVDAATSVTGSSEPAKTETPVPAATESILGDAAPKEEAKAEVKSEAKTEDVKKTEPDAKASDSKTRETKIELPSYDEFKLPENFTADKERLGEFTKVLGEIEAGKLDHKGYQEAGQKLVDLGTKAVADSIQRMNDYYVQFHENQKKEWFESAKKDLDFGGGDENKFREISSNLKAAISEYGGTQKQQDEFRELMKNTGVGNNAALLRLLNNMDSKIRKYTTEGGNNRIVPAQAPAPSKVKDYQRFYQGGGQ